MHVLIKVLREIADVSINPYTKDKFCTHWVFSTIEMFMLLERSCLQISFYFFLEEGLILTTNVDISSGNKFLVQIIVCGMLEMLPNDCHS